MIIVLKAHQDESAIEVVTDHVKALGYEPRTIYGVEKTIIGAVGDELSHRSLELLRSLTAVEDVIPIQKHYKLASREFQATNTKIAIGSQQIGADAPIQLLAGPCSVESREQMHQVVSDLTANGVRIIRGGAFKPRTSPYAFQGLGEKGLDILGEIKSLYNVQIVTEVIAASHASRVAEVADVLQVGARNSQNYHLLESLVEVGKPILLKRGMATRIEEWLAAAEYLLVNGCNDVILCERGIRTFETYTRNTLDVSAVAIAKRETHLPVILDPSHAAGIRDLVLPLAKAGIAAGADGLLVEAHPSPLDALSDPGQQLDSAELNSFLEGLKPFADATGRGLVGMS